jgi:hypothetical protein
MFWEDLLHSVWTTGQVDGNTTCNQSNWKNNCILCSQSRTPAVLIQLPYSVCITLQTINIFICRPTGILLHNIHNRLFELFCSVIVNEWEVCIWCLLIRQNNANNDSTTLRLIYIELSITEYSPISGWIVLCNVVYTKQYIVINRYVTPEIVILHGT